ncbi:MAG: SRPBCC family protein [Candidatus Brocadiae bacterium]|nr:SRPBCC family protein [Candidatus Brocadiia bacterium]
MLRAATEDTRTFERTPARIFAALSDLEAYGLWWPREIRFRVVQLSRTLVGAKLEVFVGRHSFYAEVVEAERDRSIRWGYRSRTSRGHGLWSIQPEDGLTRLTYFSDLPVHPSVVSEHFLNRGEFLAVHGDLIRRMFDGLGRRLAETTE